jgi:hypothetical protein
MKGGSTWKLEISPNTVNFLKPVKFTYNNKNKLITKFKESVKEYII